MSAIGIVLKCTKNSGNITKVAKVKTVSDFSIGVGVDVSCFGVLAGYNPVVTNTKATVEHITCFHCPLVVIISRFSTSAQNLTTKTG